MASYYGKTVENAHSCQLVRKPNLNLAARRGDKASQSGTKTENKMSMKVFCVLAYDILSMGEREDPRLQEVLLKKIKTYLYPLFYSKYFSSKSKITPLQVLFYQSGPSPHHLHGNGLHDS
jgi:hypothetical protein